MAINDFTGQNIQDTFQRVVQTDGISLADGTGSALPIKFEGPDLIVSGAIRANSYIVSESITNVTSGSTIFGNSTDDTHQFLGSLTASGNISASENIIAITASIQHLDGPEGGGISFSSGNPTLKGEDGAQISLTDDAIISGGNNRLIVEGVISASGTDHIFGGDTRLGRDLIVENNINADGTLTATNIVGTINGGTF